MSMEHSALPTPSGALDDAAYVALLPFLVDDVEMVDFSAFYCDDEESE